MLLSALPGWIRITSLVLLLASLAYQLRRPHPLVEGSPLKAVNLGADGTWLLESVSGTQSARLLRSSRSWTRVLFLHFETAGGKLVLPLAADAVPPEDFRRLRVRLGDSARPE